MAKITIPVVAPSRNDLDKMHWGTRHKLRNSYIAHLKGAIHDMGMTVTKMKRPRKRRLMIFSYRKAVLKDKDGIYGAHKQMIDAIKAVGLIWDDSEKYIDLTILQWRHPEAPKTEIYVIDDSKK